MTAYNDAPHLPAAVESILGQTFRDFEFILINDGSTDDSAALLKRYAAQDARIRLFHQENRGVPAARNEGLRQARAPLLTVMDADDVALPERLARQQAFLAAHPDHVAVGGQVLLMDPDGAPIGRQRGLLPEHEAIDAALLCGGWPINHGSMTIRRAALEEIGGYREQFWTASDHDLCLRLAEAGQLANLPDVLLKYRQHFSSLCHQYDDQPQNIVSMRRAASERRGLPPPSEADAPPLRQPLPPGDAEAVHFHYKWASLAARSGYWSTARKHLSLALRRAPGYTLQRFLRNVWTELRRQLPA